MFPGSDASESPDRPPLGNPGISVDTLRANKLRSALTILGVVIGVMSIVAMTSLIGGFSDSIRTQINQLGANTVYLEKAGLRVVLEWPRLHGAAEAAEPERR